MSLICCLLHPSCKLFIQFQLFITFNTQDLRGKKKNKNKWTIFLTLITNNVSSSFISPIQTCQTQQRVGHWYLYYEAKKQLIQPIV